MTVTDDHQHPARGLAALARRARGDPARAPRLARAHGAGVAGRDARGRSPTCPGRGARRVTAASRSPRRPPTGSRWTATASTAPARCTRSTGRPACWSRWGSGSSSSPAAPTPTRCASATRRRPRRTRSPGCRRSRSTPAGWSPAGSSPTPTPQRITVGAVVDGLSALPDGGRDRDLHPRRPRAPPGGPRRARPAGCPCTSTTPPAARAPTAAGASCARPTRPTDGSLDVDLNRTRQPAVRLHRVRDLPVAAGGQRPRRRGRGGREAPRTLLS